PRPAISATTRRVLASPSRRSTRRASPGKGARSFSGAATSSCSRRAGRSAAPRGRCGPGAAGPFRVRGGAARRPAAALRTRGGREGLSAGGVENLLTQVWLPALPDVRAKLGRGAAVADVGCGGGRALIKLARAYPNSSFVGYDAFEPVLVRATESAVAAGV